MLETESQRASYRCPVHESRDGCLTIDGRAIPVELLDESADGMGLVLDGPLNCYVGQSATLQTAAERIRVRIMNAHVITPDAVDDAAEPAGIRTRVGLRRLKELPDEPFEDHAIQTLLSGCLTSLARRFMSLENPLVTIGVPFATVVLLVLGLVWGLESERAAITLAKRDVPVGTDAEVTPPSRRTAQPTPETSGEPKITLPVPAATHEPTATEPTHSVTPESTIAEPTIPHHVLRWSHPELLVAPEIADRLALTPQQLDHLRELGKAPTDESDPHAMGRAALAILRSDQRKQWMSIVTNAHHRASGGSWVPENGENGPHSDGPFASDAEAHRLIKAEAKRPVRRAP